MPAEVLGPQKLLAVFVAARDGSGEAVDLDDLLKGF